jgi:hypothetical protein
MRAAIALIPLLLLAARPAEACDFCLIQQGISPLESLHGSGLRINQRYTLLDSVYAGSDEIPNPGAREEFWTTDVSGFFSPHDRWLLLANLPLRVTRVDGHLHVHSGHDAEDPEGGDDVELHPDRGGSEGAGDLSVLARYTAFQRHTLASTTLFAVSAGIKLPTGGTHGRTDDGEFLDAHTQLGTGSVDFLAGLSLNHALGRLSFSANVTASFNGEGEAGDVDYGFGDALNYDVSSRFRVLPVTLGSTPVSVFVSLGLAGELRGREKEDGLTLPDSGGHTVYLSPALQANFGPHWVVEISYREAIHHDLNATQLGENYKVFGSVNYLF